MTFQAGNTKVSKLQFKALDLFIFSALAAALECINIWAFGKFSGTYYLSYAVVLGLIAMVRWNAWGIIPALAAGAATVIYDYAAGTAPSPSWMVANTVGYLPLLFCLFWFKAKDKKSISKDVGFFFGYVLTGFLATDVGKAVCYLGTADILWALKMYFAYDLINVAAGLLIFFIATKQDRLVYDMNLFLQEQHQGNQESAARQEIQDYRTLEEMADKDDEVNDIALLDGGTLSPDDLKKMNETYRKMENKPSKFDEENKALKEYHEGHSQDKKAGGNKDE